MSETVTVAQINSAAAQDLQTAVTRAGSDQAIVTGPTASAAITAISNLTVKSVGSAMTQSVADSTFSTIGSSAGSPASPRNGSTAVDAGSKPGGGFTASDSSSNGSVLVAGDASPSTQAALVQPSSSGTPPSSGTPADDSASAAITPGSPTHASAPADSHSSIQLGTLGARGPPAAHGPVLILAPLGGSISAGDATLTFASGSLPDDAHVGVTVSTASADELVQHSAAYNFMAVNTTTGEVIEQFASAPQPTIDVGTAGAQAPRIHHLPAIGDPVGLRSSSDPTTGGGTAGFPHFFTYIAKRASGSGGPPPR